MWFLSWKAVLEIRDHLIARNRVQFLLVPGKGQHMETWRAISLMYKGSKQALVRRRDLKLDLGCWHFFRHLSGKNDTPPQLFSSLLCPLFSHSLYNSKGFPITHTYAHNFGFLTSITTTCLSPHVPVIIWVSVSVPKSQIPGKRIWLVQLDSSVSLSSRQLCAGWLEA